MKIAVYKCAAHICKDCESEGKAEVRLYAGQFWWHCYAAKVPISHQKAILYSDDLDLNQTSLLLLRALRERHIEEVTQ